MSSIDLERSKTKIQILKTASEYKLTVGDIAERLSYKNTKIIHVLEEFNNVCTLTEPEHDFPRKLLKYYNVNIPSKKDKLTFRDMWFLGKRVNDFR